MNRRDFKKFRKLIAKYQPSGHWTTKEDGTPMFLFIGTGSYDAFFQKCIDNGDLLPKYAKSGIDEQT